MLSLLKQHHFFFKKKKTNVVEFFFFFFFIKEGFLRLNPFCIISVLVFSSSSSQRNNSHSPLPCDSHSYSLIVTQLLAVGHAHRAITAFSLSHCETQLLTAERAHCVTTTFLLRDSYSCSVLSFLLSLPPSHSRSHSQLYSIWFSFSVIKRLVLFLCLVVAVFLYLVVCVFGNENACQ